MFSVNRLTEKISVNRFSINRTETENGGQDDVMQNAVMHIAIHQYLIVKIIPLSHRLCTRLCTSVHTTGSLLIIWRGNNWKKSIQRRILESLFRVISRLQITVVNAYATANRMLGLLLQSPTVEFSNVDIMVRLYKNLVRPHLEYSTSIWNPHY